SAWDGQAVSGVENVRLFDEVQARSRELSESLEQQTATAEILKVISSSLTDAQPVFDAIVVGALKLFPSAAIMVALPDGDMLKAVAVGASDPGDAAQRPSTRVIPVAHLTAARSANMASWDALASLEALLIP